MKKMIKKYAEMKRTFLRVYMYFEMIEPVKIKNIISDQPHIRV